MKNRFWLLLVVAALLTAIAVPFSKRPSSAHPPQSAHSETARAIMPHDPTTPPTTQPSATSPITASTTPAPATGASPLGKPLRDRFTVQRIVSRTDTALGQTGAEVERVEILQTDFRYPLVRIVSRIVRDPVTHSEQVRSATAMVADHVMVKLKPGVTAADLAGRFSSDQFTERGRHGSTFSLLSFPVSAETGDRLPDVLARLTASDLVSIAEPDYIVTTQDVSPNDPAFADGTLWGLHNTGQIGPRDIKGVEDQDIDAPEAWSTVTDASAVLIAVIDTGARLTHEDLIGDWWANPGESGGGKDTNGVDDDNDGFVDDVHGVNLITQSGDPTDDIGHGTHVCGIIGAAGNNARGTVGVAWKARIMVVKFLDAKGNGTTSDGIRAVDYAREHHARIINASWGGPGESKLLTEAVEAFGASGGIFICASGNSGTDTTLSTFSPASIVNPCLLSVASMYRLGTLSVYSNYGGTEIAAPGDDIYSTWFESDTSYHTLSGTSMAAPHVTATMALMLTRFPDQTPAQAITRLISTGVESDILPDAYADGRVFRPMLYRRVLNLQRAVTETAPALVPRIPAPRTTVTHEFGDAFTLGVGPITSPTPVTYQWLFNDKPLAGATSDQLTITNAARAQAGRYSLAITNAAGTAYSRPVILSLVGPPSILQQPLPLTLIEGEDGYLAASVLGNGYDLIEYQWYFEGGAIDGANHPTLELNKVTRAVAGSYRLVARNQYGATDSDTVTITVNPAVAPSITTQPAGASVPADRDAVFSVQASGTRTLAYQWRRDGIDLQGEVEPTLRLARAQQSDIGDYSVVVSNSGGTATSSAAHLDVGYAPVAPFILRQPVGRDVGYGRGFTLSVTAKGTPAPAYQWQLDGTPIAGATSASYSVARAQSAHTGGYSVVATNSSGTVMSDTARVTMRNGQGIQGWQWRAPLPQGGAILDMLFTGTRFVGVGTQGTAITSPDGLAWTARFTGTPQNLNSIVAARGRLVAVGAAGAIVTSDDGGLTWNSAKSPTSRDLSAVVYGNGRCLAVSLSPIALLTSADGREWTEVAAPAGPAWLRAALFANGWFYVSGNDGKLRRSTHATSWEAIDLGLTQEFVVAYGGGIFSAYSVENGGVYLTSVDGLNWVRRKADLRWLPPEKMRYVGGVFVLNMGAGYLFTSMDGISWLEHPRISLTLGSPHAAAYGAGAFVLAGDSGSIYTSPDTISWTAVAAGSSYGLNCVAYGHAGFVALTGAKAFLSDTGVLWTQHDTKRQSAAAQLLYLGGRYVAIGGNTLSVSQDGRTWTNTAIEGLPAGTVVSSLAEGGGRTVIVGSVPDSTEYTPTPNYKPVVASSTDMSQWTTASTDNIGAAHRVIHDGTQFVVTGQKGILASKDGFTWMKMSAPATLLECIAFDGHRYVVVPSADRAIYHSTDLVTWTKATLPAATLPETGVGFRDLAFVAGQFVALYADGTLLNSVDGLTWTESDCGARLGPTALAYGRNSLVVVGSGGAILQSGPLTFSFESLVPSPAQQIVLTGRTARLEVDTLGTEPLSFQWRKDGTDIPGATSATLEIPRVQPDNAGAYAVRIRSGSEDAVTTAAYLGVASITMPSGDGGTGTAKVWAPGGMEWSIGSASPWIRFVTSTKGVGSSEVTFAVGANETSAPRTASIAIGGGIATVTQDVSSSTTPAASSRLVNVSTRGMVGPDDETLIAGFVITGPSNSRVLVRAIGPALMSYGIQDLLPNPVLKLYDADGKLLRQNDDWSREADANSAFRWASATGAFPLPVVLTDAALVATLPPGRYTAMVSGVADATRGIALVEAYEARYPDESPLTRRVVNISTRSMVGTGDRVLVAGFVIGKGPARRVLIRGVGPGLAGSGVSAFLADPQLELFRTGETTAIASNDNWGEHAAEVTAAGTSAGAFALTVGSKDAAMVVTLEPGGYTVQVRGVNDTTGIGLVEVYELP